MRWYEKRDRINVVKDPIKPLIKIDNKTARHLWLHTNLLADNPTGPLDLKGLIEALGFVQLDTIQVVARAHHHILWSRNQNYREPMLDKLLRDRQIFEHFTHDASVLPMACLPYWQRQFRRKKEEIDRKNWFKSMVNADGRQAICDRIRKQGPLSTHDFDTKIKGQKQMWGRPPHKLALDYMWYAGELATSHRDGFTKFYDLADNVFPHALRQITLDDQTKTDWLCRQALMRLKFATIGEIQNFWDAVSNQEAKDWLSDAKNELVDIEIETANKQAYRGFAFQNIEDKIAQLKPPTSRLRVLNPFDPAIRDRQRLLRLFNFDYRVEMFVPEQKRQWGYYVFPLLEGDRFVGRIDMKANRKQSQLKVKKLWQEPGVKWSSARQQKLDSELARIARFVGVCDIIWSQI